jgi:hypothetical protein
MSQVILTPSMIAKESVMLYENATPFSRTVHKTYDPKFGKDGAKIGNTINIRQLPQNYTVTTNSVNLSTQNYTETQSSLTLTNQYHVDTTFTSAELALQLDDFSKRVLRPVIISLANQVEFANLGMAKSVYNSTGTPGTTYANTKVFTQAGVYLDNAACPRDGQRYNTLSPQHQADTIELMTNFFNPSKVISEQFMSGEMGEALGFNFQMSQGVNMLTTGTLAGSPTVTGGSQTGSSLVTGAWDDSSAICLGGETFTVPNVYALNPINQQSTGKLQQFTVTAAVSSNSSGAATLSISPAILPGVTVTASPAPSAPLTFVETGASSTPLSLAYHSAAFAVGTADLEDVSKYGAWCGQSADEEAAISIRVVRQYTIGTDAVPCRVDTLFGNTVIRPNWAVRLYGASN